jgi:hypothetical protein
MTYTDDDPCLDLYFSLGRKQLLITRRARTSDGVYVVNHEPRVLPLPPNLRQLGGIVSEMLARSPLLAMTKAECDAQALRSVSPVLLRMVSTTEGQDEFFESGHCICIWLHDKNEVWCSATWTPNLEIARKMLRGAANPERLAAWLTSYWKAVKRIRWPGP